MPEPVRVLIVDDHAVVREGLRAFLDLQDDIEVAGEAEDGDDGGLVLEVRDDGVGFDPDAAEVRSRRLGLTSMEERAQRIGGRLSVQSAPGTGTTVRLEAGRG